MSELLPAPAQKNPSVASESTQNNLKSAVIPAHSIYQSHKRNKDVVTHTKLMRADQLSTRYSANIFLKREDQQIVRSFKIRGAANAIKSLTQEEKTRGVVTASAGNHAQGVAYCCYKLKIKGAIFMPLKSPLIKVNSAKNWGKEYVDIYLVGNNFDEALAQARKYQKETGSVFVHAFDNLKVIEGQGGIAVQIMNDWEEEGQIDFLCACVGGGGLLAGVASYMNQMSPNTKCVGFQPLGSPSMYNALITNKIETLEKVDTFVDGAAVRRPGNHTFDIIKQLGLEIQLVPEGLVSKTILDLYNEKAVILQPAGALSVAGLQLIKDQIVGKNVVCILSGSNNQISRLPEIRLRSRIYQEKEAYYVVKLGDTNAKIRQFLKETLVSTEEDIINLNFSKKNLSPGQLLLGLEFVEPKFKKIFEQRMNNCKYEFTVLGPMSPMFQLISR